MHSKFLKKDVVESVGVFTLGNGKVLKADPREYPEEIRTGLMYHGLMQKIGDAAAGYSKPGDYSGALAEMAAVHEALLAGQWKREGVGGGINLDDLAEAIAKLKKVDLKKAKAVVETATSEKRREWAGQAKVAVIMSECRLRRLKEKAKEEDEELEIEFEEE